MESQIWPTKQPDGTIFERHVYGGPQGEGFIDIFYKEKPDGKFDRKQIHTGPEDRPSDTDFKPSTNSGRDDQLKQIKAEKAEWKPDSGFKVKPEFKDAIDEQGKEKPVKDKEPK